MSTAPATVQALHRPPSRVRVVTAASLFDGHDAAINVMRRLLQQLGCEVIHLGHDRSVGEVVRAVLQEDAHAVAISSYQGGHTEYFKYLVDLLRESGAAHVRVYGGGGGVITPAECDELHAYGVARIFRPEDGQRMGLEGMIKTIVDECDRRTIERVSDEVERIAPTDPVPTARLISWFEENSESTEGLESLRAQLDTKRGRALAPVIGFTGTGGAGKSSVVDEVVRRIRLAHPERSIGILSVDPSRRRSGGALLGDRIRMNAIYSDNVFMRSLATRQANLALSEAVRDAVRVLQAADYDWIIVETAGIGQSDSEIVDLVNLPIYVMTPEYGAPSQLEKIDMIDLAELIVLNKFERLGGVDALRDVRKQWRRNHVKPGQPDGEVPVYPTVAARWDDVGTDRLHEAIERRIAERSGESCDASAIESVDVRRDPLIPGARVRYLAEISEAVRGYHADTEKLSERAATAEGLLRALGEVQDAGSATVELLKGKRESVLAELPEADLRELKAWPERREQYSAEEQSYAVRGRDIHVKNHVETLSHSQVPKVAVPRARDWGDLLRFLRQENLPGSFPYTAGVFPFKRAGEDPARMFAGEGGPERTNRRFHYLSQHADASRLSTAFDSVTLYGRNPDERPDIYGKVGNSGVSICTVDDAKKLYSGFDLASPTTSVSMTINGPAPIILAFFLNAAIDQQVEQYLRDRGELDAVRQRFAPDLPAYGGDLPEGHDGLGLGLLGISGDQAVGAEAYAKIRAATLRKVRGTVQADILKEDQAQNTCIFSTEFALRMMGDIQQFFCNNEVRNFYSVSISGYHIAEAGANPITQLAFTLANGFTYCEYYLSRGMSIDDFAPNFSFFFSNGLDAEYSVIGRVARRIWSIALRERYGADERSQKLKYHIQTSGRSLHAQEMAFNDIRTTLQALTALQDNCNSLHTNAYDEAITTPTEESVRRAVAIQHVINRELGLSKNENPLQGSYAIEELTDMVEEAVLQEFERLSDRGGVLGAMETLYQRGKIQDESLYYESQKHSGELPIVGVNFFENPNPEEPLKAEDLMRSSDDEKKAQLRSLHAFQARHAERSGPSLERLRASALAGENVFAALLEAVKVCSLGEITDALFEVGGQYRRAM